MERRQPARNPQVWRKPAEQDPEADPLAAINQVGYQINRGINVIVEQPATAVYRTLLPQPVRRSVRNVVANFGIPVVVVNQVAQGKVNDAGRETTRFLTNSSLGVLGIFDVARDSFGILPTPREDLGQTLGNYGVSAGPALDVPVVGQTNPRDLLGLAGDWVVGNTLVPVGRVEGVGPGMAVAARLVQLDQAGPKAGFPEPTSTRGTYDLRRKQAIESRNQAIRR
jgi:phospholipid-binding lipoprotein MlaA